jgi:hypothetical protein
MADFVLISIMPFGIISAASGEWLFGSTIQTKHGLCQFVAYMFWYGILLTLATLAVISFDRCLIVKPFFYKRFIKPITAIIIIVIIWVLCAVVNITPFFGFGVFAYAKSHGMCVPDWEVQSLHNVYMLIITGIPVGCIVVTSLWTFCFIRKYLDRNEIKDGNMYISQKKRVCGIFGILLLVYLACLLPSFVIGVLLVAIPQLPHQLYAAALITGLFLTVANPLVQSIFRKDIKMFCKSCVKDRIMCHKKTMLHNQISSS